MDKSLVRRIILLLVALAMLVYTAPFACAEAPAAGGQDETVSSSGAKEEDKDKDEDEGEEGESGSEEDEEEGEEDKGDSDTPAGFVVDPALAFHGPLSSYQPRRENVIGPVWSRVTFESASDDDDDKEKLEYEATFEGGKLVRLEIEIEYEDGTEFLAFMQPFSSPDYFRCFLEELASAGIQYELLRSEPLRLCRIG